MASGSATWVRATGLASTRVQDEVIVLEPNTGRYFGLNHVAATVWGMLEQPRTFDELVQSTLSQYLVPRDQCSKDLRLLLEELTRYDLVVCTGV